MLFLIAAAQKICEAVVKFTLTFYLQSNSEYQHSARGHLTHMLQILDKILHITDLVFDELYLKSSLPLPIRYEVPQVVTNIVETRLNLLIRVVNMGKQIQKYLYICDLVLTRLKTNQPEMLKSHESHLLKRLPHDIFGFVLDMVHPNHQMNWIREHIGQADIVSEICYMPHKRIAESFYKTNENMILVLKKHST